MLAQVIFRDIIETVHKGQLPNLFENWAVTILQTPSTKELHFTANEFLLFSFYARCEKDKMNLLRKMTY